MLKSEAIEKVREAYDELIEDLIECLNDTVEKGQERVQLEAETLEKFFFDSQSGPPAASEQQRIEAVVGTSGDLGNKQPQATALPSNPAAGAKQSLPSSMVSSSTVEDEENSLAGVAEQIRKCVKCPLSQSRNHVVIGEGNPEADLMFISESPATADDQVGKPFQGEVGTKLTQMIEAMQFSREEVFITTVTKCRIAGNREPLDAEVNACLPYLKRQIDLIQPTMIVTLGQGALFFLVGEKPLSEKRGQWFKYGEIDVMPTFHPAYMLRAPKTKGVVWEDLKKVMRLLGKDPDDTLKRKRSG